MKYWLNPNYKFREEYWGGLAYFLEDKTWEIGKLGFKILEECNGKGVSELQHLFKIPKKRIAEFLSNCEKNKLIIPKKPKVINEVIKRRFKKDFCLTAPIGIFFELTYKCNMNCKHCYTSSYIDRKGGLELSTNDVKDLIDQASKMGVFVFSIGGGEPFLRKDIYKILEYGKNKNLEMIPVTNGVNLDIEKLKKTKIRQIVVSLDGSNEESYEKIRNNNLFLQVVKNIEELSKHFRVLINCVVTKENFKDIEEIISKVKSLRVRAIRFIRLAPFGRALENKQLWLSPEEYMLFVAKLNNLSRKYSSKNFLVLKDEAFLGLFNSIYRKKRMTWLPPKYRGCPAARSFIFINPYGNIYPCGYLEIEKFLIANIKNHSLEDIWQNKIGSMIMNKFRKMSRLSPYCESCANKMTCEGGCRATAYFKYNNIYAPDSLCFRDLLEGLKILEMTSDDIKEIVNLIQRNLLEVNSKDYDNEVIKDLVDDYTEEGLKKRKEKSLIVVAKIKNIIVGVGRFCKGKIFDIFVLPEFHNTGIGTKIMDYLEIYAKNRGYSSISLPASITAKGFYEKRNYKIDGNNKTKSSVWMVKKF